jgi:hypothetical protein
MKLFMNAAESSTDDDVHRERNQTLDNLMGKLAQLSVTPQQKMETIACAIRYGSSVNKFLVEAAVQLDTPSIEAASANGANDIDGALEAVNKTWDVFIIQSLKRQDDWIETVTLLTKLGNP